MFQYAFARIIAERNGLKLLTKWEATDFIEATPYNKGRVINENEVLIKDVDTPEYGNVPYLNDYSQNKVVLEGFFQHPKYYEDNEYIVKKIWIPRKIKKQPKTDIVIHLRTGDHYDPGLRSVIHPKWHYKVLDMCGWNSRKNRLFIVIEDANDPILAYFEHYKPTIISQTASEDFHYLMKFDTIIASNSSFAWWAAYLSNASNIYMFERWLRLPLTKHIKLAYMKKAKVIKGGFLT